jgi:ribosome-binding protein aMBF1 (putative translation factor)
MMRGKCDNCGKKATSEWLIQHKSMASTLKFCDKCAPRYFKPELQKIYGYAKTQKTKP